MADRSPPRAGSFCSGDVPSALADGLVNGLAGGQGRRIEAPPRAGSLCSGGGPSALADGLAGGLVDGQGRRIDYVRLSLTDKCNFRCIYCMPYEGEPFIPHKAIITYEELLRLADVFTSLGIRHYKITGGEPFCRRGAERFIAALAARPGVADISVTTNGSRVGPHLPALAESGVSAVTFSCDAFDEDVFRKICRSETGARAVRQAMRAAAGLGLRVKMNVVPLRGLNEADLIPLARHALEQGFAIRFIELMPVGSGKGLAGIPRAEVHAIMAGAFGTLRPVARKMGNGPAVTYAADGYPGFIGFISPMTGRFCASCNRVRLTSTGFFKTCLCHDNGINLRTAMRDGLSDADLAALIIRAVKAKPSGHGLSFTAPAEQGFFMNSVGG